MLRKAVLFVYCQCIVNSHGIERACHEEVIVIALSGNSARRFADPCGLADPDYLRLLAFCISSARRFFWVSSSLSMLFFQP